MKIEFEVGDDGYCITPCPHGIINGYTGESKKVGSNICGDCRYFMSIDNENKSIECDYGNEK